MSVLLQMPLVKAVSQRSRGRSWRQMVAAILLASGCRLRALMIALTLGGTPSHERVACRRKRGKAAKDAVGITRTPAAAVNA